MKQELSYRQQIARKLRTRYAEGIYRHKYYTVTLKSRLSVTQGHWKRNHWSVPSIIVTFWRLAVIDFELGLDVIVYLFTVMCDFACWSILDVVDSRMSVTFRSHV